MSRSRTRLVAYRSAVVTPDVAEAMRNMELNAAKIDGCRLSFRGTPRAETNWSGGGEAPHLSLRPSGREVKLSLTLRETEGGQARKAREVGLLWGLAVPLGFVPWLRYPIPGPGDDLFHYIGPWQPLYDHLCGQGRGDEAWPSVCCAAQTDVGAWEGDRPTERFIQGQLHRLGLPCGAVDGIIGDQTTMALRALGMGGMELQELAEALAKFREPKVVQPERRIGHIIIPGDDVNVLAYGKIAATHTKSGVALTIDGPGRVIVNIGDEV